MLNVTCPNCQQGMKLAQPKAGKFAPKCNNCNSRFQLLIKELPDKTFRFKVAPIPQKSAKNAAEPKPAQDLEETSVHQPTRVDQPGSAEPSTRSDDLEQTTAHDTQKPKTEPSAWELDQRQSPIDEETRIGGKTENKADLPTATSGQRRQPGKPVSGRLGPYRLLSLLGEGGMGSVYLAKQTTLDRNVALKVVKSNLSSNAAMLARFTREAYAAAQLVHPNVVQIYDMGDAQGNCYFSMELVDGDSLLNIVKERKKLDPEQATIYILHAARGLQCAHNSGMVHRDIKPANLLVNQDGVVKVADLGLVKVADKEEIEDDVDAAAALSASQDLTRVGAAIGTPYYMAPEQAKSSIDVDHRADIYSLGCTYYVLLTGRRPFEGDSFQEVVSQHSSAPLVEPSRIVERVPRELSAVVAKMMAKQPDDRYQSMDELISDLEQFLGLASTAAFTPDESDADEIEQSANAFNGIPLAKLRGWIPLAMIAGSLLLAFVMSFVGWRWATGFVLLPIAAIAGYFVIQGTSEGSPIFAKARELILRSGFLGWLKWVVAGLLLVAASFLVGSFGHWAVLCAIGVGLGAAYYFAIDKPIAQARKQPTQQAETLLRKMRLKGMDESTVQFFVARYAGNHWEEFFEQLFGYEAKRRVRDELRSTDMGKKKPRFRAWRDGVFDNLARRVEALTNEDDQKHLQKIEQAGLVAQGVPAAEAQEQAAQMAAALVDHGDSLRVAALQEQVRKLDPKIQRLEQRMKVKSMLAEARSGKYRKKQTLLEKINPILNMLFGSYPRFVLGCCLILGSLVWASQNGLLSVEQIKDSALKAKSALDSENSAEPVTTSNNQTPTEPLSFPVIGGLFHNFNSLVAGLLLVCSAAFFGWRMSIFALPAAGIALLGSSIGVPEVIPVADHLHVTSALAGIGLFVVGIVLGRSGD